MSRQLVGSVSSFRTITLPTAMTPLVFAVNHPFPLGQMRPIRFPETNWHARTSTLTRYLCPYFAVDCRHGIRVVAPAHLASEITLNNCTGSAVCITWHAQGDTETAIGHERNTTGDQPPRPFAPRKITGNGGQHLFRKKSPGETGAFLDLPRHLSVLIRVDRITSCRPCRPCRPCLRRPASSVLPSEVQRPWPRW